MSLMRQVQRTNTDDFLDSWEAGDVCPGCKARALRFLGGMCMKCVGENNVSAENEREAVEKMRELAKRYPGLVKVPRKRRH